MIDHISNTCSPTNGPRYILRCVPLAADGEFASTIKGASGSATASLRSLDRDWPGECRFDGRPLRALRDH